MFLERLLKLLKFVLSFLKKKLFKNDYVLTKSTNGLVVNI